MRATGAQRRARPHVLVILVLFAVECAAAGSMADLSGVWAERLVLSEFATLPLVGELPRTSTITLRVVIEPTPAGLLLRQTYCATDIVSGSGLSSAMASTTIPEAFLASLGEVAASATLEPSESLPRFDQPGVTEIRGARLDDPNADPLPTAADDPRVIDQDGDGKPGLTVHVSALGILTGDVYVVQRVRTRLVGTLVSPDRIEGLVEWSTEQVTLGATNPLFLGTLPSRPDPVAENSSFVLVRMDPAWGCAEILEERDALFASR